MKRSCLVLIAGLATVLVAQTACETMFSDATRRGSDEDFIVTGRTQSFFIARQVDPRSEDSAGPQVVAAGDFDGDGMMDLASAWNQSQPVQAHIQRRDADGETYFITVPIAGTTPIARVSGLVIQDMDGDSRPDLVVLVKDTGMVAVCDASRDDCDTTDNGGVIGGALWGGLIIFFAPADPINDIWEPVVLTNSFFAGAGGENDPPEVGGYTGLTVTDIDGVRGPDIIVALNSAEGEPPVNRIDLYLNPGNAGSRTDDAWDNTTVFSDFPNLGTLATLDVDRDGDSDIVAISPNARSSNVFWLPNPLIDDGLTDVNAVANPGDWNVRAPLGHVDTGVETLAIGDVDGDGLADVVVRSELGKVVQWFQAPAEPSTSFVRNPWRVFTLAEFLDREPEGMAIGDLTGDDQIEAVIAADGAIAWFEVTRTRSVYDHWSEHLIVDDTAEPDPDAAEEQPIIILTDPTADPTAQDVQESGTAITQLLIVDIDGDGANDIVATIDRSELSGLADDALVWFRNLRN